MDDFRPPPPLTFDDDLSTKWKTWKQMFQLYLTAKESDSKTDVVKISMLLTTMGHEGVARFNHFEWGDTEDKTKYNDVIKKFDTELGG